MKQVIEDILNNTILPEYEDLICGFEVKEPHERFDTMGNTPFEFISVTVSFIAGYGTKYWPITLSVRDKFDDIMNDIWDVIYNYTNIATDVYHKTVRNCEGKVIKESKEKSSKISLAKKLIYGLFSEVSYIKISEYHGKPLIEVYFDSDDTAANIESFFTHEICDTLKDYTGGEIICNPGWGPVWRTNRNNPDILIDAILLKYDDEGNVINESKENNTTVVEKNINAINTLLSLVSWDGLCNIWVEYNPEDGDYEIRSKTTVRHLYSDEILKELESLENSLRSMGIRVYIYTPWYVESCEDEVEFMNESENKKSNYVKVIKQLVEPFKNEDCVCDIGVSYDEEDDMYGVYVVLGHEELNDNFFSSSSMGFYAKKLRVDINKTIVDYLPIKNLYVGAYGVPNCDWKPNIQEAHKVEKDEYVELPEDIKYIKLYGDSKSLNESKTENSKLKLVKNLIYEFFDEVSFIEQKEYKGKPLIKVYFESDDPAANIDSWLAYQIKSKIKKYTSGNIILVTRWTSPVLDFDFYIDTEKIKYDDEGNVINEAHKVEKDEYVELYRDKDFILTIPLTHDASKKYGSDTKWCTTTKDCNKDFKKHTELGVLGYIVVRDKELKERLGGNAFALYRLKGDDFTRTITFDDQNNEYRNGESWLGNKFDRVDKLFQFYKMMNKYNDYFEKQDTKETIEESKEISKKDLSEDMKYNKVNTVLNRVMSSKYDWWKGIEIDDLHTSKTYFIIRLKGVLKVDEEWGEKQWNTYMLDMEFPGNSGWEDNEAYELVTLGDVIGSDTSNQISDEIIDVLRFTGVIDPEIQPSFLSFRSIMLKFV